MQASKIIERARRENLRWRVLECVHAARVGDPDGGVMESVLHRALNIAPAQITRTELRMALDWLRDNELISLDVSNAGNWYAELRPLGHNCIEYPEECPRGISPPPEE